MTANEIAFLVLGAAIGSTAGMVLGTILRARPGRGREVRVTVATDAIPRRRAATLAEDPFAEHVPPALGGPAEIPAGGTPVRPVTAPSFSLATAGTARGVGGGRMLLAVPMGSGIDPAMSAIGTHRAGTAVLDPPLAQEAPVEPTAVAPSPAAPASPAPAETSACAEERRVAAERCEVADRARVEAQRAHDTLRAAQRAWDEHTARAEEAAEAADPRAVRAAKDAAQHAFRSARVQAVSPDAVDEAARTWLAEINRINGTSREAAATALREQHAAREAVSILERLSVEADAARIAAESADAACLAAREVAASCEEDEASAPAERLPSAAEYSENATSALRVGGTPTIFRLLGGDRTVLLDLVERLSDDGPDERRRWQTVLVDLVDAILAAAIEATTLDFPEDHAFWGTFTVSQQREIAEALASLGYRYDGLGGWQDERIPSQRDLSLALGYAGLDPMRMRQWPTESEMAALYAGVRVAGPEFLSGAAGDLTLGELVTVLGRRADALTDAWNAWGRIRPLLLEDR